jgi:preprotein translocase subunit Sec61beta
MPDDTKPTPPPPGNPPNAKQPVKAKASDAPDAGHIPFTEEMDSAKWTLPPIIPLLVAAVVVGILVAVVVLSNRTKPSASLAITKVVSAAQEGNTMVAIQIKLDNQVEGPLWIKQIQAEVETPDGKKYNDSAAPGVDAPRYMEAFPPLAEAKADWLKEDLKIPTKTSFNGVAIFSYPVDKAAFDKRKQVTLRIQLYDRPTLVAINTPTPAP